MRQRKAGAKTKKPIQVQNNSAKKWIHVFLRERDMFTQCCTVCVHVCECKQHRQR